MSARRASLSILVCALVCASACRTAAGSFLPAQPVSTSLPGDDIFNLQLTKETLRANGASDALLDKISASAFRYFRAVAEPFKHRTCESFRDLRWRLPSGAVHGDAHLEQFVVTDEDFGLADFDNAGYGPAPLRKCSGSFRTRAAMSCPRSGFNRGSGGIVNFRCRTFAIRQT